MKVPSVESSETAPNKLPLTSCKCQNKPLLHEPQFTIKWGKDRWQSFIHLEDSSIHLSLRQGGILKFFQHICLKMLLLRESYRCLPSHFHSFWRKCFSRMNLSWQPVGPNIFLNFISLPCSESLQRDAGDQPYLDNTHWQGQLRAPEPPTSFWKPKLISSPKTTLLSCPPCSPVLFPLFQTHLLLPPSFTTSYWLLSFVCHFPRLLGVQEIQMSWSYSLNGLFKDPNSIKAAQQLLSLMPRSLCLCRLSVPLLE